VNIPDLSMTACLPPGLAGRFDSCTSRPEKASGRGNSLGQHSHTICQSITAQKNSGKKKGRDSRISQGESLDVTSSTRPDSVEKREGGEREKREGGRERERER
jgi:hypothetical protein